MLTSLSSPREVDSLIDLLRWAVSRFSKLAQVSGRQSDFIGVIGVLEGQQKQRRDQIQSTTI